MRWAQLFVAVVAGLSSACAGVRSDTGTDERGAVHDEPDLDVCLGDHPIDLDPSMLARVRSTWEQLARHQTPAPLALAAHAAGHCISTWWTPVTPLAYCGAAPLKLRPLHMPGVGTVLIDAVEGTFSFIGGEREPFDVDGALVTRVIVGDAQEVQLESSTGPRPLPGFPEHVIDDRRALVLVGDGAQVVDTLTGDALDVRPKRTPRSIAGTVVVPDASRRHGVDAVGAVDFGTSGWLAFVVDHRGRQIVAVEGPSGHVAMPVVTRDRRILLAALDATASQVTVASVAGGVATTFSFPLPSGTLDAAHPERDLVVVAGEGDLVVVGVGARAFLARAGGAPYEVETGDVPVSGFRSIAPLTVLAGGRVVILHSRYGGSEGSIVVDTMTSEILLRVRDPTPRVTEDAQRAIVLDNHATDQNYAVVVDADASLSRGRITDVTVGRFTIRAFAGIPDPSTACDARALSILPPLVQYPTGPVFLPASLVVQGPGLQSTPR